MVRIKWNTVHAVLPNPSTTLYAPSCTVCPPPIGTCCMIAIYLLTYPTSAVGPSRIADASAWSFTITILTRWEANSWKIQITLTSVKIWAFAVNSCTFDQCVKANHTKKHASYQFYNAYECVFKHGRICVVSALSSSENYYISSWQN